MSNEIIYEAYTHIATKAVEEYEAANHNFATTLHRQQVCGTIEHELDNAEARVQDAHDRLDWISFLGRWNPFRAKKVDNRIEMEKIDLESLQNDS